MFYDFFNVKEIITSMVIWGKLFIQTHVKDQSLFLNSYHILIYKYETLFYFTFNPKTGFVFTVKTHKEKMDCWSTTVTVSEVVEIHLISSPFLYPPLFLLKLIFNKYRSKEKSEGFNIIYGWG